VTAMMPSPDVTPPDERLDPADFPPRFGYALVHTAAALGQLAALVLLVRWRPPGVGWAAPLFVAIGLAQYRLYFPLHDASHGKLFPRRITNRRLGRVVAALLFTTYPSFVAIHLEHHRRWGERDDPGAVDYFVHFRNRREQLRFFLWPLLGLSVFEKIWTNFVRPAEPRTVERGRRRGNRLADFGVLAAIQGIVLLAISGLGAHPLDYVWFYLVPGATIFLFFARFRMYLEHGPLDYAVSDYQGARRRRIARTHVSALREAPFTSYMNFKYHNEHHRWPWMPSSYLPEIHRRLTAGRLDADDYNPTYLASVRRLVRIIGSEQRR